MIEMSAAIFRAAAKEIGTVEVPGAGNNPKIVAYYRDAGHPEVKHDSVPWCAAFVGSMLFRLNLPHTGKLNARSYLSWGREVRLDEAVRGDVVVFKRGDSEWKGHVGFFDSQTAQSIRVLGGNQRDAVNIKAYPKSKLLGIRRVKAPAVTLWDRIRNFFWR